MWVKLHLQRLQPGLCQLRFQLRGPQLSLLRLPIVMRHVAETDDDPVESRVEVQKDHEHLQRLPEQDIRSRLDPTQ